MKRFTVPCDFNGVKHPFHVYIGEPHPKKHPLQFQAWWLSTERGGTIPQDVMDSFEKLFKISQENNVSFEDLCVYALGTAAEENAEAQASTGSLDSHDDGGYDNTAYQEPYHEEYATAAGNEGESYHSEHKDYNPIEDNPIPSPEHDDSEYDSFSGSDDYQHTEYTSDTSSATEDEFDQESFDQEAIPAPYKPDKDEH